MKYLLIVFLVGFACESFASSTEGEAIKLQKLQKKRADAEQRIQDKVERLERELGYSRERQEIREQKIYDNIALAQGKTLDVNVRFGLVHEVDNYVPHYSSRSGRVRDNSRIR